MQWKWHKWSENEDAIPRCTRMWTSQRWSSVLTPPASHLLSITSQGRCVTLHRSPNTLTSTATAATHHRLAYPQELHPLETRTSHHCHMLDVTYFQLGLICSFWHVSPWLPHNLPYSLARGIQHKKAQDREYLTADWWVHFVHEYMQVPRVLKRCSSIAYLCNSSELQRATSQTSLFS